VKYKQKSREREDSHWLKQLNLLYNFIIADNVYITLSRALIVSLGACKRWVKSSLALFSSLVWPASRAMQLLLKRSFWNNNNNYYSRNNKLVRYIKEQKQKPVDKVNVQT